MTPVLFRFDAGEVTAVFPTLPGSPGLATCYAHLGQHSSCSRGWFRRTRAATAAEYAGLQAELVRQGYDDLAIKQRWTRTMDAQRRQAERS